MTSSIPFSITPDAEEFIRDCIAGIPRQAKPTLRRSTFQSDGLKRPRWYYKGESLVIGYFNSDERDQRGFVEFQLFGRSVAVESEALKYLSGRVLGLRRVDSHIGLFNIPRYVLVAGSADAPARQGRGSERITSDLSITALTILGGFTGMGVAWIVYGIIGAVFKIPVDRLFALKLVWAVLITGWILGAIVSFFFFRSVFKAHGRSGYSRDPKQSNYRVRGDARANLDWWIFLGVPAPVGCPDDIRVGAIGIDGWAKGLWFPGCVNGCPGRCNVFLRQDSAPIALLAWHFRLAAGADHRLLLF